MIMGVVYLAYSAYFLSSDFQGISKFMKGVMSALYMALGFSNTQNVRACIAVLADFARETQRENPNDVMLGALVLKAKMLRQYLGVIIGYFGFKVFYHLVIEFMDD